MAEYKDLRNLFNNSELMNRTEVAVIVAAEAIVANFATETAERIAWAQRGISGTLSEARKALRIAIAINKSNTVAQILAADDVALQANVDAVVDTLAKGLVPG